MILVSLLELINPQLLMKKITLFFALLITAITYGQVVINEIDADQEGTDNMEFIELLSDTPNQTLDGLVVVLFNGSDDASYNAIDLDGFSTDANGFFIIGGDLVPGVDIAIGETNAIQNGADAVAIFQGNADDFPNDTPVTMTNLIDAVVYDTGDADDDGLLMGLGETAQINEDENNDNADFESVQRRDDGTYCTALTTLRAENMCPNCSLLFNFNSGTCDTITGGQDTVTFLVDFTGGGNEDVMLMLSDTGAIGGDDPSTVESGTIEITGVSEGTDITLNATGATCNVSIDLFSIDCTPATNIANIAALRASNEGQPYILTGEAILTFQQDFRNQKFIEDATAAILIDDPAGIITTAYTIGDGISGITGTLGSFNGQLQFIPEQDPGTASSNGNTITPQIVTITELNANPEDYESELVLLEAIVVDNTISSTWISGTEFPMQDQGSNVFVFRTSFFDADYIDQDVPTDMLNIAGIITERNNGDYFFTARDSGDFELLALENNNSIDFSLFPNPAINQIQIITSDTQSKLVEIYSITGALVLSKTVITETLDISALSNGLYIVRLTQGNAVATTKLIKQ